MAEDILHEVTQADYKYGFTTDIETDIIPVGLNEDVVRIISAKKNEPEWMLDYRLKAYHQWTKMKMPEWAHLKIPAIDYQSISYYAAPRTNGPKSLDEVDPELLKTFNKLGIPLEEQMALSGIAVDAVMDSVSVKTTFKETLAEKGIIFCSFSEAVEHHPDLIQKYMSSVVPVTDNFMELVGLGNQVDIIIDVTGAAKVREQLRQYMVESGNVHTVIMHEQIALLMMSLSAGKLVDSKHGVQEYA